MRRFLICSGSSLGFVGLVFLAVSISPSAWATKSTGAEVRREEAKLVGIELLPGQKLHPMEGSRQIATVRRQIYFWVRDHKNVGFYDPGTYHASATIEMRVYLRAVVDADEAQILRVAQEVLTQETVNEWITRDFEFYRDGPHERFDVTKLQQEWDEKVRDAALYRLGKRLTDRTGFGLLGISPDVTLSNLKLGDEVVWSEGGA